MVSERTHIKAEARTHATHLAVEAEAEAIRIKAQADADIRDEFAQEMGRRRQEIASMAAFGNKAVFIPTEATRHSALRFSTRRCPSHLTSNVKFLPDPLAQWPWPRVD